MSDDDLNTLRPPGGELAGRTLGKYEIGEMIGQGGMATVYLAHQAAMDRTVAVKVLPAQFMTQTAFLERFKREVQVIARLQHPRILPVYDFGEFEGRPYIVMAYLSGGTLQDRIAEGPLPLDEAARILEQISEGLDHAHKQGVVHRDFKPSNVLLDSTGNAYLADFGIAKINEATVQLTGSGIVGTPAYMAPEMADRGEVTTAVDIYALGVTLYEMLTGRLPFQGETPLRVMLAHAREEIPDVRAVRPDVPPAVAQVIRRAMAKRPEARPTTASQLASELRDAMQGIAPTLLEAPDIGTVAMGTEAGWSDAPGTPPPHPATRPVAATPAPTPPPAAYTPPPAPPTAPPAPYTPPPSAEPRRRGCSTGAILGVVGGVVVVGAICVGAFALGGAAFSNVFSDLGINVGAVSTDTPQPPTRQPDNPLTPSRATDTPTAEVQGGTDLTFQVTNESGVDVCAVYISPAFKEQWEDTDQYLPSGARMLPGESRTFNVPPGDYDLRADDCQRARLMDDSFGFSGTAGQVLNWSIFNRIDRVDNGQGARLTVINETGVPLCYLYISPPTESTWGPDELGEEELIDVGEQLDVWVRPGTYDLMAKTCDESGQWDSFESNITSSYTWRVTGSAQSGGYERDPNGAAYLTLINNSSHQICFVYVAPTTDDTWGPDEMQGDRIPVGTTFNMNILPGRYDLRAETCDQVTYWEFFDADASIGFEWTLVD